MESNRDTPAIEKSGRQENPGKKIEQETVVATLVDVPRLKVQLIKYEFGADRHFLLRRTKWFTAETVRGSEIKLEEAAARMLVDALTGALAAPRMQSDAMKPFIAGVIREVEEAGIEEKDAENRAS